MIHSSPALAHDLQFTELVHGDPDPCDPDPFDLGDPVISPLSLNRGLSPYFASNSLNLEP